MSKACNYALMHINFVIVSFSFVLARYAGFYYLFSLRAMVLYGLSFVLLGVYAIIWQQVIKQIKLSVAYANRTVIIILGMLWGVLFFGEEINAFKVIGVVVILIGVALVARNE